jgi:hypothetical protein
MVDVSSCGIGSSSGSSKSTSSMVTTSLTGDPFTEPESKIFSLVVVCDVAVVVSVPEVLCSCSIVVVCSFS